MPGGGAKWHACDAMKGLRLFYGGDLARARALGCTSREYLKYVRADFRMVSQGVRNARRERKGSHPNIFRASRAPLRLRAVDMPRNGISRLASARVDAPRARGQPGTTGPLGPWAT